MPWVRLETNLDQHPAIRKSGAWALQVFETFLRLAKEQNSGGLVPADFADGENLAYRSRLPESLAPELEQARDRLVERGMLEPCGEGWSVVGWARFQQDPGSADRSRAYRERHASSRDVTTDTDRHDPSRDETLATDRHGASRDEHGVTVRHVTSGNHDDRTGQDRTGPDEQAPPAPPTGGGTREDPGADASLVAGPAPAPVERSDEARRASRRRRGGEPDDGRFPWDAALLAYNEAAAASPAGSARPGLQHSRGWTDGAKGTRTAARARFKGEADPWATFQLVCAYLPHDRHCNGSDWQTRKPEHRLWACDLAFVVSESGWSKLTERAEAWRKQQDAAAQAETQRPPRAERRTPATPPSLGARPPAEQLQAQIAELRQRLSPEDQEAVQLELEAGGLEAALFRARQLARKVAA